MLVVSAFRDSTATVDGPALDSQSRARVGVTAGLLIGFCLLLPWIGYPAASLLFTGLLLRGLGAKWGAAAIIAVGSALGSYYVFGVLLGVPLPRGTLFD